MQNIKKNYGVLNLKVVLPYTKTYCTGICMAYTLKSSLYFLVDVLKSLNEKKIMIFVKKPLDFLQKKKHKKTKSKKNGIIQSQRYNSIDFLSFLLLNECVVEILHTFWNALSFDLFYDALKKAINIAARRKYPLFWPSMSCLL